ncbi:hypothetical protein TNCV_3049191 [Trichonephila clavipes]|nr:hypothetical protein TNCV_3049191 [Trichonephila clavipes]
MRKKCRSLRCNSDSVETVNLGDRAKLASYFGDQFDEFGDLAIMDITTEILAHKASQSGFDSWLVSIALRLAISRLALTVIND